MSWYKYILIYEVIITWQREERLDSNFVVALVWTYSVTQKPWIASKKDQRQKKNVWVWHTIIRKNKKLKLNYNLLERQFVRYYDKAKKMQGVTGENMLILLEQRLDNLVYRIGFGNSIRQARQMVNHGHILVNGRRVDIPSYSCKPGDVIELREASPRQRNVQN